ncbi:MAG TPA: PIN domain-containing protein [Pyrinomonadaceae bacterium]|jgi:hypothetical protein
MNRIFIDTSCWIALINASDSLHGKATETYESLVAGKRRFITHEGVLLEVGNALSSKHLRLLTIKWKAKLDNSKIVEVIALTDEILNAGWQLYANRPDKDWGIIDCISFVLMEKEQIREALTADHHFGQAGFVRLL